MRGNLTFLVGIPRSGKSTFVKKYQELFPLAVVVSSDKIRLALHGERYNPLAETMVFAIKHVMIRALLDSGYDVIVDGTHSSRVSIRRLLEIDPNAKPIQVTTSEEVCIERAIKCGQEDLIPAIKRISRNLKIIEDFGGIDLYIKDILREIEEHNATHQHDNSPSE